MYCICSNICPLYLLLPCRKGRKEHLTDAVCCADVYQQHQCVCLKRLNSGFLLDRATLGRDCFPMFFVVNCQIEVSSKCISIFQIENESKGEEEERCLQYPNF